MKKVKGVLGELMRQNGRLNTPGVFKEINGLLMKWQSLDIEEKNKQFYKNFCHELNFFIKNKDQEYF